MPIAYGPYIEIKNRFYMPSYKNRNEKMKKKLIIKMKESNMCQVIFINE